MHAELSFSTILFSFYIPISYLAPYPNQYLILSFMKRTFLLAGLFCVCLSASYSQEGSSVEKLRLHLFTLASDSLKGRGFGSPEGHTAAEYIAQQFAASGVAPLAGSYFQAVEYRSGVINVSGRNVLGFIEGSKPDLKDEYIVIGAHYDHLGWEPGGEDDIIYYGADDNASGTAALMEIGRVLAANREKLGRSVILAAFDGEESGLIGSTWFTEHSPVPLENIKGMISLDMVGMYLNHSGVDLEGFELFSGYPELRDWLEYEYNLDIRKVNDKIEDRTDTEPFGKLKIPSMAVTTGMESPYHKPEDQADLIDYEGISVVADAMSGMVQELSNNEVVRNEDINWDKAGKTVASQRLNIGIRCNFGSSQQLYLDEFYNGRGIFNAEAGVYLRARLSEYLTVMPEVHLEHKGSRYNDGSLSIEALTLPLNLLLTTPDRSGYGIRTYALIGGYYSLFLDGEVEGVQIDFTNDFMDHEYGITAGFGLEFMNLQYGFYYKRGLSGILQDPAGGKVVHRTISLMLGWTF